MNNVPKIVSLASAGLVVALIACRSASAPPVALAADPCSAPETQSKASQAASLVGQQKFAEAEGPAKEALAACPGHAQAAQALGAALVAQKKYDEAISRLEAVVAAKGDVAYAYYWLGHAYYNKKQTDKMTRNFDKFLQLAPNSAEAATVKQLLAGIR